MVSVRGRFAQALALAIALAGGAGAVSAEPPAIPAGAVPDPAPEARVLPSERRIALKHRWTGEEVNAVYRIGDAYQPEVMAAINRLLRDYRCQKETQIDPKLIDLIYELHQELGGQGFVRIVSAYRSEGYNASLLRAGRTVDPDSQHTLGKAADVIFPGVKADRLRAAAEARGIGGVGYYPFSGPIFVHLDTGPVRHWVEDDPKQRRALGVQRKRFVLDCTLTAEKVFEEISAQQAYAALPEGASTKPNPEAETLRTALSASAAIRASSRNHGFWGRATASIQAADGPACLGWEPLARLAYLQPAPVAQGSAPKANVRQALKVRGQVKAAKRGAAKARPAAKARKSGRARALIRKR
jgi:uncharacterized protein YcbK (DUF882 family)